MVRRAFTIVELLVVVAVIGLLTALLLPAVRRARGAAVQVQCASRLRAIGQAFVAYAAANDGRMVCTTLSGTRSDNWVFWEQDRDINKSALAPYLSYKGERLRDLFRCPAVRPEDAQGFKGGNNQGKPYPLTFTMNGFLHFYPSLSYRRILNPGRKILLYDENENADDDIFWYQTDRDTLAGRHGSYSSQVTDINDRGIRVIVRQMGNAAFFDSHVELVDNPMCHTAASNDPSVP